jgi:GDSL-like lipase/acylhydrolase family protein
MVSRHRSRFLLNLILLVVASLLALTSSEALLRVFGVGDPPVFQSHPSYGYLMQPNQWVSTRGHRFRINQAGFRGDDWAVPKRPETIRTMFLGDSITFGGGSILDDQLFVNRVKGLLAKTDGRNVETLNAAAPGWGIENMAAFLGARGTFDADVLIWTLPTVDFRRPKTSLEDHAFPTSKPWLRLLYLGRTLLHTTNQLDIQPGVGEGTLERNVALFRESLTALARTRIVCVVLIVPASPRYDHFIEDVPRFRAVAEAAHVPFVDLHASFRRHPPEALFTDGVHLSVRGHELVAEEITPIVRGVLARRASANPPAARH